MKNDSYNSIKKMFSTLRIKKVKLGIISVISLSLSLYFSYLVQAFIDAFSNTSIESLLKMLIRGGLIGIAALVVGIYQNRAWHYFRYYSIIQIRTILMEKIMEKKNFFFQERSVGDITAAIITD